MQSTARTLFVFGLVGALFFGILSSSYAVKPDAEMELERHGSSPLDPVLLHFVTEKHAFAKALDEKYQLKSPAIIWKYFAAAESGDWLTTSNLFGTLKEGSGRSGGTASFPLQLWGPILEVRGAYEQFQSWNPDLLKRFAHDVSGEIPNGSIYFGGTDGGRFIISAFSQSHGEGRPFFTMTQNALVDGIYIDYLREMYGSKIYIPTIDDSRAVFQEYLKDAQIRSDRKQLKEGEEFSVENGRIHVRGVGAVMLLNERLVRLIVEKNHEHEFFMEESFVFESLYPQLIPHGLIFKILPQPLERLPNALIEKDHQFWAMQAKAMLGHAMEEKTTVPQLCAWAEKVYARSDYADFNGNQAYAHDPQAPQSYSKARSAMASLYEWRSKQREQKSEAVLLTKEADFAHRQAYAFAPFNSEAVWRYTDFLFQQKRTNDAKLILQTTLKIDPSRWTEFDAGYFTNSLAKIRRKAKELKIKTE